MGGTAEVLQEYLVKLGFQTDAISLKKFDEGMTATQKKVLGVGTTAATAAIMVEAAVADFAYSMREMYFTSKLANTSVSEMQKMSYAGKQVGISASDMQGTLVSLGMTLRMPGMEEYAHGLGAMIDKNHITEKSFMGLIKAIDATANHDEYQGTKIAETFHISDEMYIRLVENMDKYETAAAEAAAVNARFGIDADKAAIASDEWAHQLDRVALSFKGLEASFIGNWGLPMVTETADEVERIAVYFSRIFSGDFKGALAAFSEPLATAKSNTAARVETELRQQTKGVAGGSRADRNNNPGNLKYAGQRGAIGADAQGFAIFPDMATGFAAQKAQFALEGRRGNNTIAGIMQKYAPPSENNTAAYIADVSRQTGFGANQPLDLSNPAIQQKLALASAKHEGTSAANLAQLSETRLGTGTVDNSIHVTNNITAHGSSEPQKMANYTVQGIDQTMRRLAQRNQQTRLPS